MNAINFRIGNIVERNMHNWPGAGRYWDILSGLDIYNLSKDPKFDSISPIILTEQWLLKFGFENIESNSFYLPRFSDYDIVLNENNAFLYREDMVLNADIKYVHQLQNLYFALTGEELIFINP